jgi:hypothetical protein
VSDDAISFGAELPIPVDWELVKVHIAQLAFSLTRIIYLNNAVRWLANGLHAPDKATLLSYIITIASRYCLAIILRSRVILKFRYQPRDIFRDG